MPMLTLFAIPKAFVGHIGTIQRNAIMSWTLLRPRPEIILLGFDEGTAEIAQEFNLTHIPDIECNEQGTPLMSSLFALAQTHGKGPLFAYVNSDIVLFNDFMAAIQQLPAGPFMMLGQRCDLDVQAPIDVQAPDWEQQLRDRAHTAGRLCGPWSMDYFVFAPPLYQTVPPFAIGRLFFDNWLCYEAIRADVPVIDATEAVLAIHQNHDYAHYAQGYEGIWKGQEGNNNLKLLGGMDYNCFQINCANWTMTTAGLKPPDWTTARLKRCLEMLPLVRPEFGSWAALLNYLLDHRFYSDLDEAQMTKILQNLGEALFSQRDRWMAMPKRLRSIYCHRANAMSLSDSNCMCIILRPRSSS